MKDAKVTRINGSSLQVECPHCGGVTIRPKRYFDHLGPSVRCPKCIRLHRVRSCAGAGNANEIQSVSEKSH
jgi:ribosomal protein S27E